MEMCPLKDNGEGRNPAGAGVEEDETKKTNAINLPKTLTGLVLERAEVELGLSSLPGSVSGDHVDFHTCPAV